MNQTEAGNKKEIELPSRSAYNLAAAILFINASFSFILYYTTGTTGAYMFGAIIDIILIILLIMKNDAGRIIVLLRAFFGLLIGYVRIFISWDGLTSIEALIILSVFCISLMYILAGETTLKQLFAGSICLGILFLYHVITLSSILI